MEERNKPITIVVNGDPHEWLEKKITYAQVVTLDIPDYAQHPEVTYSVKYSFENGHQPERVLAIGASVEVKEGIIFTVTDTGQS